MKTFTKYKLSRKEEDFEIFLEARFIGSDLNIIIYGGEAHIGAVTMAEPDEPMTTISRKNHRDEVITQMAAKYLAENLSCPVLASCGIHYPCLSQGEIKTIQKMCEELIGEIVVRIAEELQRNC